MSKIKRRHERALLAKAVAVFSQQKHIPTGYGLSRKQLRYLERRGIVEKRLTRTDAGNYLYLWGLVRMPQVAAATELSQPPRQWPNIKPGFFYRLVHRKEEEHEHGDTRKKSR